MKNIFLILIAGMLLFSTGYKNDDMDSLQQNISNGESVSSHNPSKNHKTGGISSPGPISFNPKDLRIDGDLKGFKSSWKEKKYAKGIFTITLTLHSPVPATPPKFTVKWKTPSVDIYGFWTPKVSLDKSSYYNSRITSRAARYAPVVCLVNQKDQNRLCLAVSDTLNKVITGTYVKEEDVHFYFYITFFSERTPARKDYQVQFRIDTRNTHFAEVLKDVARWWASMEDQKPAPVPEAAKLPLYSTWYSFHQSITADEVVHQCQLAKALGFEAVIVDDGWQTLDSQRGYRFTGDWEPVRIPDMKDFVQRIHRLDMKFLLWYSLPFIGEKAKSYSKFKGKYLRYWESQGAYVLDPRYPGVREHIIKTYETALKKWNLDGFKLDFMGWFVADKDTVLEAKNGRDFASVDRAVDRLMTDIMTRLRTIKPNIMVEFRQPYIGPRMRKYGNMFRATDCPNMALINRVRTTDVRLLCGNTAVHSDMYVWHNRDTTESAALQLLNVLFSVPQLSVKLEKVPSRHLKMIKFWTRYWRENRHELLEGTFIPSDPTANYPIIRTESENKTIVAVYADRIVTLEDKVKGIDIINAKPSGSIILDLFQDMGKARIKISDCMGNISSQYTSNLKRGLVKIEVPPSGLIRVKLYNN